MNSSGPWLASAKRFGELRARLARMSISEALPRIYLVLGLVLGVGYALLVPLRQVPDESGHFIRAYGISQGHCLADATVPVPLTFADLALPFNDHMESADLARASLGRAIALLLRQPLQPSQTYPEHAANVDVYSCVPYIPAAVGIAAARALGGSMLVVWYAARLASLLAATLLTYLALRILPVGRIVLAGVALLPMTLHQAASPSADSISNAVAFLLVAVLIRLAMDDRIITFDRRIFAGVAVLLVMLALTKLNVFLMLLAIAIPSAKFGGRGRKLVCIGAAFAIAFGTFAIWNAIDSAALARSAAFRVKDGIDWSGNYRFVLQHPFAFVHAVLNSLDVMRDAYVGMFIGNFGLLAVPLPGRVSQGCALALVVLGLTGFERRVPRNLVFCAMAAAAISIALVSVVTFASELLIRNRGEVLAGTALAPGIQGRYYIPYAFTVLLALTLPAVGYRARTAVAALAVVVLTSISAYGAIYDSFWRSPIVNAAHADMLGVIEGNEWDLDVDRTLSLVGVPPGAKLRNPAPGLVQSGRWAPGQEIATYNAGTWRIGMALGSACQPALRWETSFRFGTAADQPVFGDWFGTGTRTAGLFRDGVWTLRDPRAPGKVLRFRFGRRGDVAVAGDWDGDGRAKPGVFRKGLWLLDQGGFYTHGIDLPGITAHIMGAEGARPVVGDWNGDGRDKIGVVSDASWVLDVNGDDGHYSLTHRPGGFIFGNAGDVPLVGRWACGSGS